MFAARTVSRLSRAAKNQQTVLRRNFASGAHSEDIPGQAMAVREILTGIALGLGAGLAWKSWQWNDKAKRIENNNKWDKFYPVYAQQVKAELEAAEAADAAADEEPEAPVEQEENEDRPQSADADADSLQQQPLPLEKKEPGKYIPSKVNQQDL